MGQIIWGDPSARRFETGLDRGVLYPKTLPAVPWNGLISVEEHGGEEPSAYYIDGRPFLFLPKPKEYSAQLSAYTYPDEFSELMGLVEAAPGMYLDSQMGNSFDLSYRTMVGSSTVGQEPGYKLHLVYNATASASAASYESLGSDINPVAFSWSLQAVPVHVEGYRPTAHVVIDTRNMDPVRLVEIEQILYGTNTTAPTMPAPQVVFDILTFGDAIVIFDNGDGTWTAKGAHKNIYMIGDGIFQIDNVNAVDQGDGTYIISTTT